MDIFGAEEDTQIAQHIGLELIQQVYSYHYNMYITTLYWAPIHANFLQFLARRIGLFCPTCSRCKCP